MQSLHVCDYFCYRKWNLEGNFGQERLSPEPAQSVKVRARKGREIPRVLLGGFQVVLGRKKNVLES